MSSRPVLRGDHNRCPACGEIFNSSAAFDEHRVGRFADTHREATAGRRCLTPGEMEQKGMRKGWGGFWKTVRSFRRPNPFAQTKNAS